MNESKVVKIKVTCVDERVIRQKFHIYADLDHDLKTQIKDLVDQTIDKIEGIEEINVNINYVY